MATNNQLNLGLSGSTGTGNFVGANTPTLITPVLGVSTATSINFGVDALGNYTKTTSWTPVLTFATPGNLSVVYTNQVGEYVRIGNQVTVSALVACTPTFTTASGNLNFTGLPFAQSSNTGSGGVFNINSVTPVYPTGTTFTTAKVSGSTTTILVIGNGTGVANSNLNTTHFVSGNAVNFLFTVTYNV